MEWIRVEDERKPLLEADETHLSVEVLLYVPAWKQRDRDPVVLGNYLYGSKTFRPSNSHGWEDSVTHWCYKPEPPE